MQVQSAEAGELTVTTLDKEATPAIRYRTGDRVRRLEGPCPCGRQTGLIEAGTIGRYDDMLKVKGVNLWPDQVDDLLLREAFPIGQDMGGNEIHR